ncbi:MAG TPA: protein kinase [Acidimicrobiales bacterium]|nr:protein kinase [Acidimicrobiales bacterium]
MPDLSGPPATADVLDGRLLAGRYRLGPRVAAGGMAEVRRATDLTLGREVAVKVLHAHLAADAATVERFRREAIAAARLNHPSIVAIYDTCSEAGVEAIVMELVRGVDLRDFLDRHGPLEPRDAIDVAAGVAEALQVAHEGGIVHRDVKPANILLCDDRRVMVTDFGIAKAVASDDLTSNGSWVGTAKYLAPEQVRGERVDPRTDVYALGLVLYESLCGRAPFEADTEAATALARLHRDPLRPRQIRPSIPRALDDLVVHALARDPAGRPPTAAAFRTRLLELDDTALAVSTLDPTATGSVPPVVRHDDAPSFVRTERSWLVPTALILVVATALGIAGLLVGRTDAGREIIDRAREAVGAAPRAPEAEPVEVVAPVVVQVRAFDPQGTGPPGENDELAPFAIDGDPTTAWRTEGYETRDFGGLPKSGVGLSISLAEVATVQRVIVESPSSGWSAGIHVAPADTDDLTAWGDPVVVRDVVPAGRVAFELGGVDAGALLLWITDLGDGPPRVTVEVAEIAVEGPAGSVPSG